MNLADARDTLSILKRCAVDAGLYENWFLSFGTLLGAVRRSPRGLQKQLEYGIIEHDDDLDIGILSDRVTASQEAKYVELVRAAGLFGVRDRHQYRTDNGRHAWASMRRYEPPTGTKCCHWFWFEYKGYMWHSKGRAWVEGAKFHNLVDFDGYYEAAALGAPVQFFNKMIEIDFEGGKYNIPLWAPALCDFWYPGWMIPKPGGASAKAVVLGIKSWGDKDTWQIMPKKEKRRR